MVFLLYYNREILVCFAGKIADYAIDLIRGGHLAVPFFFQASRKLLSL
jgi:hypothetical protein